MEKAGQILGDILKKHDISKVSKLGKLTDSWPSLMGQAISSHTSPNDLRDGILFLMVDSPVWMQQLSFLKAEMLKKLSMYEVADIILRLGKVEKKYGNIERKNFYDKREKRILSAPDLQLIDNCATEVENTDLKKHIERLLRKALQYPTK